MGMRLKKPAEPLKLAFVAAVFLLFLYYMLWQVNFYLCRSIRETYFLAAVPVLVAGTLYFRRLKDGPEYILLLSYWLWLIFTRFLNGDPVLVTEYQMVLELSLMLPFLALGLSLDRDARRRFLNWLSAAVGGYYFILGVLCIAAFILRVEFVNPITEGLLGIKVADGFERINILDINVCSTACWFMFAFFLMVYQFFACKNKWLRIPIVIAGLVHYATIAMTYTRSAMVSTSLAIGILAMLLVYTYAKTKKKGVLALLMAVAFLISTPLCYKGFALVTEGFGSVSRAVLADDGQQQAPQQASQAQEPQMKTLSANVQESAPEAPDIFKDPRGWNGDLNSFSSNRIEVYKSAFYAIGKDPSILWRGTLIGDTMTIANEMLYPRTQPHFHNFLIQVLMLTGLPGLFIIVAFCVMVAIKAIRLFFSRAEKATLGAKVLILPVIAMLCYSMLEACIFTANEIRSLSFYLICGIMLGFYYDIYPRKIRK